MFKRGDRVVCIKEYCIDKGLIGEIGTVYTNCKTQAGVCFDNPSLSLESPSMGRISNKMYKEINGKCWHFRYHPEQYLIKIDCIEIL